MPTPRIENLDTSRIAHIMTEALKEFAQNNYHKASFNRIIKNCGISKGTMYYYFENKQDIFMTLLNGTTKDFAKLVGDDQTALDNSPVYWEEVGRLLDGLLNIFKAKPVLGKFIQNFLTNESRKSANPASGIVEKVEFWLEDFLLRGQLIGAVRRDIPLELQCQLTWSVWETCNDWLQGTMGDMETEEARDMILDLLQRTLVNHGGDA